MMTTHVIPPDLDAIPAALRERPQWVLWRLVQRELGKKPTKVPFRPGGAPASSTDSTTWRPFEDVRAAYESGGYDGVGYVFSDVDSFTGIDLDGCRDAATGELAAWARTALERFGTYAEVSPSGTGVHLIMEGALPPGGRKRGPVECYDQGRFFTITGRSPDGGSVRAIEERWDVLAAWHAEAFPPKDAAPRQTAPEPGIAAEPDDDRLLDRARRAKNGKKFRGLFDEGDWSAYGSRSEADLALCGVLAFWTKGDAARVDRLFRRSRLMRPKWDESAGAGQTYGQKTIDVVLRSRAAERPEILFTGLGGDIPLHKLLPPTVTALASRCADAVYARGDVLARVVQAVEPGDDGIKRSAAPRIVPLPDSILRERLDEAVRWMKEKKNKSGDVVQLEEWCPRPIVEAVRDRAAWPGIRPLIGVATAPTLRPDGTVLDRPGYDAVTGLIYAPACSYPAVPQHPTEAEVAAAYKVLLAPFREFPLPTPADEAAVAALMLQIAGRFAIAGPVPMLVVFAPEFGSGKTLLVHAATISMTGHGPDEMAPVGGRRADAESEMRKRITTVVMEAPRVALLDNVPDGSTLESPGLAALLTCSSWTDRVLGVNRKVTLPHRVVWVVTGNNVRVAGDLGRRSLSVQIDPGVERPSLRTFQVGDLLEHVRAEHPRLLVAALTVLRGFHVAGRPGHGLPALGMFTAWDGLVRGGVIWAHRLAGGEADPLDTQDRLVGEAPDREVLDALLRAWHARFGPAATTAAEGVERARNDAELHDAIVGAGAEHGGKPDARRLGKYLQKVAGRVIHGLVFERRGAPAGTARWGVRPMESASRQGGDVGVVGVVGVRRSPSTYVYARAGPAGARARDDLHHSHNSNDSNGLALVEAASRGARGGEIRPACPLCARTDRGDGRASGCRPCAEFVDVHGDDLTGRL